MSAAPVNRTVNIYINQAQAEVSVQRLQKTFDKLSESIKKGEAAGKDMTKEIEKLGGVGKRLEEMKNVMDGKMAPSIKMMRSHVRDLRKELEGMSQDADGYKEKLDVFHKADAGLQQMEQSLRRVNSTVSRGSQFWSQFKAVAFGTIVGNTIQAGVEKLLSYVSNILSSNAKLSDSLSDVRKATGLTTNEVASLNKELGKINTRTKAEELRQIAIGLGQIGEAANKENVANIDKIVVALGDEFGGGAREITTVLGVLRNNLQDLKTGNYGEDVLHIGNALNKLGAEGLATAPVITDIATRVAGIAQTFGVSSGQILGVAATMQELGIETERGSTAFVKVLQKMTQNVDTYARVAEHANISQKDFVELVKTDILAAFQKVAEGAKLAGDNNVAFGKVLKDLDADGTGAGEVISKLASNSELLNTKVQLATASLKESSSITEEFNTKNSNLAAWLEKIEKRLASAFTNGALSNFITSIVGGFAKLIGVVGRTDAAVAELTRQFELVQDLEWSVLPYVQKYEELAAKATLTAIEQEKLNVAIKHIAEAVPAAVTAVDAYGRAIDVSTPKFREYLRVQQEILKIKNEQAIGTAREEINTTWERMQGIEKEIALQEKAQKNWEKAGWENTLQKSVSYVNDLKLKLMEAQGRLTGLKGQLLELETGSVFGATSGNWLTDEMNRTGSNKSKPLLPFGAANNASGTTITPIRGGGSYISEGDSRATAAEAKQRDRQKKALEQRHKDIIAQLSSLHDKILGKSSDLEAALKSKDDEEVANAHAKYDKLRRELDEYAQDYIELYKEQLNLSVEYAGLTDTEKLELQSLYIEQFKRRSDEEYALSLQGIDNYYNQQKQKAGKDYADKLITRAAYTQQLKKIETDEANARALVANDYKDTSAKAAKDAEDAKTKAVQKGIAHRESLEKWERDNRIAGSQLAVLLARKGSQAEYAARKEQLKLNFAEEVRAIDENSNVYKEKQAQLSEDLLNLDISFAQSRIAMVQDTAQQMLGVWQQFNQTLNEQDQAKLQQERQANEERKRDLQRLYDEGLISKEKFQTETEKLDKAFARKENDQKRNEFNRNKAVSMAQVGVSMAMATANIWANWAAFPPAAAALNLLALGIMGAQLGMIAASSYPSYGKGGRLQGAKHSEGGISLIDSGTNSKVGEVEGDEVVLSAATARNNPDLVNKLLESSMNYGGRAIDTGWLYTMPQGINSTAYQSAIHTQVITASGNSRQDYATNSTAGLPEGFMPVMQMMLQYLKNPPPAKMDYGSFKKVHKTMEDLENASRLNSAR